ncbi:hypothetical protein T4A_1753 [Trichinella pseudospiralis]|uniref:Uncharacterized protein n=1 Tax=Trichinella pseudospiralis TaxID=6337 RepID=A0A0V1EWQ5_TRIPS|nr:hypothetical protein T4A_1753 [Trichinella pseudospiralis]KRZ41443.1 hypothetical protein T4C_2167 [Trichinella pseudospiralis]
MAQKTNKRRQPSHAAIRSINFTKGRREKPTLKITTAHTPLREGGQTIPGSGVLLPAVHQGLCPCRRPTP